MRILTVRGLFIRKIWITGRVRYAKIKTNYYCGE